MVNYSPASPSPICRSLRALVGLGVLALGSSQASALPWGHIAPPAGFLLVQGGPPTSEQRAQEDRQAPLADLYEILGATRTKLEELTKVTAAVAADTKRLKQIQALEQDNERLAAELQQANARRTELESSGNLAAARIAELTKTVDAARRESVRLKEDIARLRQQNEQLGQNLARADAAGAAAAAATEKIRVETAKRLKVAGDEVERSKVELTSRREQLEMTSQELAKATRAREQVEARMTAMEGVAEHSRAKAERLKTELAQAKEQLDQAAGAAVAAERARQTAISEAEGLRGQAERARQELTATRAETARFKSANAELEKQMASLHADSRSATETARDNLIMMAEKIEELNAALDPAPLEDPAPTHGPQAKPMAVEAERRAPSRSPSTTAQPAAPEPAAKSGADQPAHGATTLSMVEPAAAPSEVESQLASFRAKIQALNELERKAGGAELFSGIKSAVAHEVHVGATAAWDTLPPVGQQSYLGSLLDAWLAAQGGKGPAVVRIVDRSDRVLLEKSWP